MTQALHPLRPAILRFGYVDEQRTHEEVVLVDRIDGCPQGARAMERQFDSTYLDARWAPPETPIALTLRAIGGDRNVSVDIVDTIDSARARLRVILHEMNRPVSAGIVDRGSGNIERWSVTS